MNSLWDILAIAIGISFIFMLLSVLNSWIQEYIATVFNMRAKNLADIMQNLLEPGSLKLNGHERAKAPPENIVYKVRDQEKPSEIARKFEVPIEELRNANLDVLDNLPLEARSELKIPERSYKVRAGDTIRKIASESAVPVEDLKNANPKVFENERLSLDADFQLKIPEYSYNVQGGDTIRSIAGRFGIDCDDLEKKNSNVLDDLPLDAELQLKIPEHSYKVQVGDTRDKIENEFQVPIEVLQKGNPEVLAWLSPNVSENETSGQEAGNKSIMKKIEANLQNLNVLEWLSPVGKEIKFPEHSYTLQTSDKISKIAEKLGVKSEELQKKNPHIFYELLLPMDEEIKIPEHSYTVPLKEPIKKLTVEEIMKGMAEEVGDRFKVLVPVDELQKANPHIFYELSLPVDEEIKIPMASYTVKTNDTIGSLVKAFGLKSSEELRKQNHDIFKIFDENPLSKGKALTIPQPKVGWYNTVGDNETLASISRKYGISIEDLQKANKGLKGSSLQKLPDGTSLKLPRLEIDQMTSRRNLKKQLIANPVGTLYSHPLIHSLSKPGRLPGHIPTQDFTAALLDFLDDVGKGEGKMEGKDKIDIEDIIRGIKNLDERGDNEETHPLAFRLRSLLHTAQINTQINTKGQALEAGIEEFQKSVSTWFDDTVARGSLWYKRRMQRIGILCGFLLAVVLNADAIGLLNALSQNPELRTSVVQSAQAAANQGQAPAGGQAQQQLNTLGLPIGWSFTARPPDPHAFPNNPEGWIGKIFGLLLTGFAISQGSQIWFDLMNRLLNLRSSGASSSPDGSKEKEKQ